MNKKYFETKTGSIEEKITQIATEQPSITKQEPNVRLETKTYFETKPGSISDVASKIVSEALDPVNKDAVKKKFDNRQDKDIDNDGDTDSTDKYLHKRRAAISKNIKETEGTSGGGIYALRAIRDKKERLQDELKDLDKKDPNYKQKADALKKQIENQKEIMKRKQREVFDSYDPSLKEDDMAKFHQMQKDGKSADEIAKALGLDLNSVKKLMDLDEARIIKSMLEQYFRKKVLDEKVGDDAKRMGLTYYKFGRYGKDGKITHTSKDGRLVSVPKKDQKSVSQAPKTTKTGPFSPIKGGGNFLGPKKTSKPKEKKPESTPKAIQLSKTVEKQVEKIYDTDYNYKDKAKFEKDLSSVMKSIKGMADSDKTPDREYGLQTINTFRKLSNLEDAVAQRRSEVKNNTKEDDVLADIQFKIRDIWDRPLTSASKDKNAKSKIDYIIGKTKELGSIKEGVDNPYAVGMAQAMKSKNDEPPLKKSTITKAHDIAKSIMKKEEICPKCGKDHANKINASNCGGMRETKSFSQLRTETKVIKLGDKGKTVTGKDAAAVDVEPSTKPI